MNDSEQSCVLLFWWIQEIIPHIEIHSTLHKKSMILSRVVLKYSHQFKNLSYTLRFIAHYIRNEWFWAELRSTIPINSRNYLTHWDWWHITQKVNDSEESSLQVYWWIQEIVRHIDIHGTLHKKSMILIRILFNYFDQFNELSHTLRFIAHYIRNEWFWKGFPSTILMNSRYYPTHWGS